MATLPVLPKDRQLRPTETLRRGVSFVLGWVRADVDGATGYRLGVMGATLLTFGLGFLLWDRFPLREDEAIYAYWARHFAHVDPWFLTVWPDKPPLFLWSLAGAFELFGASPAAARFVNMAATGLTVPVVAAIARRLWGPSAGLLAGITFALNPFVLSFAPTAFTDPLLVLWGMLALYAALARRPLWTGIALGAAIMTKQQGLLFVPLVVAAVLHGQGMMANGPRPTHHAIRPTLLGLALVILPIILWDSQRWAVAPSPWDLAGRNYGGLSLLPVDQWWPRWRSWSDLLWYVGGSWAAWLGLLAMAWGKAKGNIGGSTRSRILSPASRLPSPTPLLLLWTAGFLAFHLFTTVQPWDRYLLPLAPMMALLVGWMGAGWSRHTGMILGLAWLLILLPPGLNAARGGVPLGGDHGDYAGLDRAFAWVQTHAPADAVLYHQELGWQHQFYLFGQTQQTQQTQKTNGGGFDLRWTPSAVYLADNAAKTPHRQKFLIQPAWAATQDQPRFLPMRGVAWVPRFQADNVTVYEIVTPPGQPCDWCVCAPSPAHSAPDWAVIP